MSDRYQEIFSFVKEKIQQSGFEDRIPAGIVLTGGSSKTEGIEDSAEEIFHTQVRVGIPEHIYGGSEDIIKNPEYATCVGLLIYAKEKVSTKFVQSDNDFQSSIKKFLKKIFYDQKISNKNNEKENMAYILHRLNMCIISSIWI